MIPIPVNNKILIEVREDETKKIITVTKDLKKQSFFYVSKGDKVILDLKQGDELLCFDHTHFQGWKTITSDCEKVDGKHYRFICDADVWGVIKK